MKYFIISLMLLMTACAATEECTNEVYFKEVYFQESAAVEANYQESAE